MSDQRMDVFLLAAPQPGVERSELVRSLANAFKKDVPAIEKMLRRPRTLVKADIEPELAAKYKALIEKSGGQCELAVHGQQPISMSVEASVETPTAKNLTLEPLATPKVEEEDIDHSDAVGYCVKCGSVIRAGEVKCSTCFTPVTAFSNKNKTTAGLLAFFVGGLGIHRLYLGQWWGIIYLLFWGTLIPSIVSIIEAIVFWSTSKETWDEKYGSVPKNSGVMAAVFVVSFFVCIAITGILAAVALPAYQDYTNRAKINKAMPLIIETRNKVESFIKRTNSFPSDNVLVGLPDDISNDVVESIKLQEQAKLEVTFHLSSLRDQNTIIWTPKEKNGVISWNCTEGSMQDRYRPAECRGGKSDTSKSPAGTNSTSNLSQQIYNANKSIFILVPESWKIKALVPNQEIGAANLLDENYIVILADSKSDFEENTTLSDYSVVVQQQLGANIKNGEVIKNTRALKIANLPGERFIYQGSIDGLKVAYVMTLLESDKHFYRILAWTLQSRLDKNQKLLESVSDSINFK